LFRIDKKDVSFDLPRPKRDVQPRGQFVKERSDIEIQEAFLQSIIDAKKTYVTLSGADDRVSYEMTADDIKGISHLLDYAKIVREIGPIRTKAFPPEEGAGGKEGRH